MDVPSPDFAAVAAGVDELVIVGQSYPVQSALQANNVLDKFVRPEELESGF
jgi:hypothetical protein